MKDNSLSRIRNAMRRFHNDEDGIESLEMILVLSLVGIVIYSIYKVAAAPGDTNISLLQNVKGKIGSLFTAFKIW